MSVLDGSAPRRLRRTILPVLAVAAMTVAAGACSSSSSSGGGSSSSSSSSTSTSGQSLASAAAAASSGNVSGSLTVWVDAVRLPVAQAYAKAHPNVHVHIVTFDGDGNGATSLQTKIQLWNRTGSGWPDVIFSEQVNDPIWMAEHPFNFAEPINGLIPQSVLSQWPSPSTSQCTIDGKQYCLQDNLAQVVLWVNKKLMDQFGYTVPTTWQQWAALGQKAAAQHPGYVIGTSGESFSHWIYFWGNQCPLSSLQGQTHVLINVSDPRCTEMASLLDPVIANGTVPPLSVFTPDFAKKYGGTNDKVLMMPGPAWYALSVFQQALHIPAGQMTAAMPLSWDNQTPITTGQVGGGPWVISRHSTNLAAAANFVEWATTVFNPSGADARPGYPAYEPLATSWLASLDSNPYFAAPPGPALKAAAPLIWTGWDLVTYPDQPVWSQTVITGLVAGKSLSSLMPAFGHALGQTAQAAGYEVSN